MKELFRGAIPGILLVGTLTCTPASAQSVYTSPSSAFVVTGPSNSTVNVTSVGSSATPLPGTVVLQNSDNGAEATLNATITPGSPPAALAGGQYQYLYQFEGVSYVDTTSGTSPGGYANGPIMNVVNQATLGLSNSVSPPAVGSPVFVLSAGADGYPETSGKSQAAIYNAGFGGAITVTNSGSLSVTGNTTTTGAGVPWNPFMSGLYAISIGGNGAGAKNNDTDFGGNGGNGGGITINTDAGSLISMAGSGSTGAPINGITAFSVGGAPGCRCSGDAANTYGSSGSGGSIFVYHAGTISGTATNSIGIAAFSIGGDGGLNTGHGVGATPGTSGPGGPVNVTLENGSSISLTSGNGIGVLAASSVGDTINSPYGDIAGGPVSVTVDQGASIAATGSSTFNMGVVGISTGSPGILQPFAPASTVTANGSGYSGSVSITNNGSITTSGQLAVGIAALSIGGAGILTSASGGSSYLGNAGSVSLGTYCLSGYGSSCVTPSVSVTNGGTITTDGASAFGILAAYNGAGGLINAASNATTSTGGSGTANGNSWSGGVFLGGQNSSNNGSGGPVQVTNSGTITTGDSNGGGKLAIGILAQSIGGGGGSSGGGVAALIGDAGGTGGNGGTVSVTNNDPGRITTYDDGAIGILAQSVGGGGGNGGNAAGVFVAVGGSGGSGGGGNTVTVTLGSGFDSVIGSVTTAGDFAAGVIAQSIGGGGGNGGFGTSGGLFVDAAIGGTGGNGGNGGTITLNNYSQTITTSGQDSLGILAQSVGGGGGNGGAATAYSVGVAFSSSIALGGTGGLGGGGGTVTVNNNYHIRTTGPDAIGLIAQSIGGGGGTGGASMAKSLAIGVPDIPTISFTASLGGSGGGSSGGGTVIINNAGQIITTGNGAHGLLAQSIGAGGGNGGDSTAASHAIESSSGTIQLGVALGATGGTAGDGGSVTIVNGTSSTCGGCVSQTQTGGDNAAGIAAQSIGGGGGNSTTGQASAGAPNLGGNTGNSLGMSLALGASGGAGGTGGTVEVTNDSGNSITTTGSGSPGILAQSIGGGGGNAGGGSSGASENNVSINVSVGGNAGSGSTGGFVTVTNGGPIATSGGDSVGILAQSIGGGGGVAGSTDASASITAAGQAEDIINVPSSNNYSANVGIGGKGGSGAYANTVMVTNTGSITTTGERAYGIEAQSIGGGGGNGGAATSTSNGSTNSTYSGSVTVGGGGGVSGNGGVVTVTSSGAIVTTGYNADGILAQSIGGGGGVGGEGSVTANTTLGLGAGISGNGGGGGTAQSVSVTTSPGGAITTLGDDAVGILAQTIGGGGGTGTAGCTNSASAGIASFKATACFGNTSVSANGSGPADFWPREDYSLNVGGGSGASGNGNNATVSVGDAIITTGARAMGVVAQSIGGGGGYAAAAAQTISGTGIADSPGANGSTGGPVSVTVASTGSITTSGPGAWGILAQSIGGGGGFSGDPSLPLASPVSNTLPRTGSGNAFANTVGVTVDGNITTTGANAHGVFAQAIGGSGGFVAGCCNSTSSYAIAGNTAQIRGTSNATFYGDGGAINITQSAGSTIQTSGSGSIGIFAQSSGNTAALNAISVTIGGTVTGGTNQGVTEGVGAAGLLLSGGGSGANPNTITINPGGSLGTVDGINGVAIITTSGDTNVINNGTLTGSTNMDTDPSTILNNGLFNTGSVVIDNLVTNAGTVDIFGRGTVGTTHLQGDYIQTGTGVLAADIDALAPQTSDHLVISGTARFGGQIVPVARTLLPGSYTILTADTLSLAGLSAQQALLFHWGLSTDGGSVSVSPSSNFTPAGVSLSKSQVSLADYLTNAWNQSDRFLAPLFGYHSQIQTASQYIATSNALSPRATQALPAEMENSAETLLGTALSCPVFVDQGTLLGEDSCVWAKLTGGWTNQGSNGGDPGYNVDGATYRLGAQKQFAPGWYVGGSLGAGENWATSNGSTSHGDAYDGSLAIKHTAGPWLFAGSVALANEAFSTNRVVNLPDMGTAPGTNTVLTSDSSVFLAGGRARAAYEFTFGNTYLRPYGDLDVVYTHTPSFQESGPRGPALAVGASDKTSVVLSPMVEFGGRYNVDAVTVLRPYLAAGLSVRPDNTRTVNSSFIGGLASDGTFQTVVQSPDVVGNVDIGAQLYRKNNFEVRAEYGLHVGESYLAQTASARIAYHF